MGKFEEEQSLSSTIEESISSSDGNVDSNRCERISKLVRFRCVLSLIFSGAVFLSAIFLLPPFFRFGNRSDLDPDSLFRGHDAVASFKLERSVSMLDANIRRLEYDIYEEISIPNSTVVILSLKPSAGSNSTNVVFGVVPNSTHSNISSASLSLLRSVFVSLVVNESSLHLTPSLFGEAFSFKVLKFKGGITVIPQQSAFLLQKVQILFNFTLSFSIYQIQENFHELKNQLKSGLYLTPYENLYVILTNSYGSTADPPTTIQASVLLAIGNNPPPLPRLKQLAQTITGSHARNLGLNNTVFGRVKQVRLSSVLQHSLNSGGNSGTYGSPSPSPLPLPTHRHHRHHRHQHHHHDLHLAPAPAPAPEKSLQAKPPSGCRIGFSGKVKRPSHSSPTVAPVVSPHHSTVPPHPRVHPPAPSSYLLPTSPLPSVVFAHGHPPSKSTPDVDPPYATESALPLLSSSSAGPLQLVQWSLALLLPLIAHLL